MYDHMREDEERTLLTCAHYVLWNSIKEVSWMFTCTSAAQHENKNCTHLFSVPLLTSSEREKPDESLFRGPLSQLSTSRIAALISEEPIPALNNMCLQSFLGSHHSPPNVCSHASVNSISANENEKPLVSDLIELA